MRPGWRTRAIAEHRRLWDLATHGPDPTLHDLFPNIIGKELAQP